MVLYINFMRDKFMENNNLNKLAYQKPELKSFDLSDSIQSANGAGDDGLGGGLGS